MQREMRKKERQLTTEEAAQILRAGQYGVLALVCADGTPYGVPMSYAYADGKLYFHHTNAPGLLNDCALSEPGGVRACFTVVGNTELLPAKFSTKYESAIAFGTLRPATDKVAGLMQIVRALCPDFTEPGEKYAAAAQHKVNVYELTIETLTGKARREG